MNATAIRQRITIDDFSEASNRTRKIYVMERLANELRASADRQRSDLLRIELIAEAIRERLLADDQWESRLRAALDKLQRESLNIG